MSDQTTDAPSTDAPSTDAPPTGAPSTAALAPVDGFLGEVFDPPAPIADTPPWAERPAIDPTAMDTLFRHARTPAAWRDTPVEDTKLTQLFELLRMGPTSANCSPARFLFLRTTWAKERLRPMLSVGNRAPATTAPVVAIIAHDPHFYHMMWRLFPRDDAKEWFSRNPPFAAETAFRNGTLQGAYLILAARAVGLDAWPMSGFDNDRVDAEFLSDRGWKSNFLVGLGHADASALPAQPPRLSFDEACVLL